jgi:NAD(P)-dependent dehydrogenase (short-subunit alcohol dehydrogenase family)
MKNITFFGGKGGLGTQIIPFLNETKYNIKATNSKNVNFEKENDIKDYFSLNSPDIVIIFSNYNYNSFLHKYTDNEFELSKQIDTNIKGITKCISYSLESMRKNNYGRIIIASSVTVDKSIMGTSIYAASKAYYENIVKTICLENASKNITANCIQLGYMDGGLTYTLDEDFLNSIIKKIPSNRLGSPEEIANTINFLIENSYVNGTTIKLTGGL